MNKLIQCITASVALCTIFVFYIYVAFFYRFAFNYETEINGQYFAAFIAISGLTIIWVLNIFRKDGNNLPYYGVIIVALLLLIPVFWEEYGFGNEYWADVLSVFILFACLIFVPARIIAALPYFLVAILLWQLWLAFDQMDGFSFDAAPLTLQGSLQNSGVFCCYLVIHLPLLYYITFDQPVSGSGLLHNVIKWLKIICYLMMLVFIAFIIYRSQSRSAIIGVVAAISCQCLFTRWETLKTWLQRMPEWAIFTSIGFLIIAISYAARYLFFLKKASAFGRAMKWEIAGSHIGDHFFTGTGIGRFSWYYPQWQAQYFAANSDASGAYYLSAGESYIIFNEYLQLFETIGLVGFAGFMLLLYWFFKARSVQYARLLSAIKITVVVLLATGLTTYSFHVNVFLVLLAICFAITAVISHKRQPAAGGVAIRILLFMFLAYAATTIYQQWKAAESWNKVKAGHAIVAGLNTVLRRDGKYLTEYGQRQLENGHPKEAVEALEIARKYFLSRNTIEALATAYERAGNYRKAIETWRWLCDFLPNKFTPRHELLKLCKRARDTASAKKVARIILTMPVKIPSYEVDRIKEEAKEIER